MADKPPRQKAVALGYDRDKDNAPKVLAKGSGTLAEKIIEVARAHGIHIKEDPLLIELLASVEIDQEIPPVLYQAVAEILAFVYRLNE
jgi:flagellar biosynthesis protein